MQECSNASDTDQSLSDTYSDSDDTPKFEFTGLLKTQGGGHGRIVACDADTIAKPLFQREKLCYESFIQSSYRHIVPGYYGTVHRDGKSWIVIEDLTRGFASPCVADFKLGTRSYEVGVSKKKELKQIENCKNTMTTSHAVRLIDMRIRKGGEEVRTWERKKGRTLTPQKFISALNKFLTGKRRQEFDSKLRELRKYLREAKEQMPGSRLYSASLLVCYDGDNESSELRMKLIDFAHGYVDIDKEGGDSTDTSFEDNTLSGISNLIGLAQGVVEPKVNPIK